MKKDFSKLWMAVPTLLVTASAVGSFIWQKRKNDKIIKKENRNKSIYKGYYSLLHEWFKIKNRGESIATYFNNNNINKIAIYGMGTIAEILYMELKDTGIKIEYFIDQNADRIYKGWDDIPVVHLNEINDQDTVDAIVVTPIFDFEDINIALEAAHVEPTVISMEEIVCML